MTEKVFLSYARQDRKFVESLKPLLKKYLTGKTLLVDVNDSQHNFTTGDDVRKTIKLAMDSVNTVIIVSSPDGDNSQWVNYEAGLADALGKKLVIFHRKGMKESTLLNRFAGSAQVVEVDEELGLASN